MIPATANVQLISEVEKALIGSAAAAGAPLFNKQHRNFRGNISRTGLKLAAQFIEESTSVGLPPAVATMWHRSLGSLVF